MNMLQEEASKYIKKVSDGVYALDAINNDELSEFKHRIIDYKVKLVEDNVELGANDLALVRTMPVFPNNLTYDNTQTEGITQKMYGPFEVLLSYLQTIKEFANIDVGCDHKEINDEDAKLNYLFYRDTKHFSLNGLASNVCHEWGSTRFSFNNKSIILIEPFTDHIDKTLAVLNPVDTFYDLSNDSFKIGKNGVIILSFDTYKKLIKDPKKKADLSKLKVFLFSPNNIKVLSYESVNTYATDIVLSYLGYIPTNSVDQTKLRIDGYVNPKASKYYSDDIFIEKFNDLIDDLSNKLLGLPYRHIPDEMKLKRKKEFQNVFGVFHDETEYATIEDKMNLISKLDTAKKYFDYLNEHLEIDADLSDELYNKYVKFINDCHGSRFGYRFYPIELEDEMMAFIQKVGYRKFIEVTKEFNSIPKDKEIFYKDSKTNGK